MSRTFLLLPLLSTLVACGAYNLGAAPGGSQDIAYARMVIEAGGVPEAETFTVGGLLNEHDMPIVGEQACAETLCIKGASGVGRVVTLDQDALYLQVGYDSDLEADTFQREPLNLVVVIDISGSMGPYLDDVKGALHKMLDQLRPEDRLSIVTYGSRPQTLLRPTLAADREVIARKIDKLESGGSTDMEGGMERGYSLIEGHVEAGVESRLMLFTDVQPNVGATSSSEFEDIVRAGAEQGIGLTLFGTGVDFGHEIAQEISQIRGANYYYLAGEDEVAKVFDEDFDYLVTPLAYDLDVQIMAPMAWVDGFNIQGSSGSEGALMSVEVATVFLNRNEGASVVLLELPEELAMNSSVASMELSYEDRDGQRVEQRVEVLQGADGGGLDGDVFAQVGTRKAAALVNMGMGMQALCGAYYDASGAQSAGEAYWEVRDRLEAEGHNLEDEALLAEVQLLDKLAENAGLLREDELADSGDSGL